MRKAILSSAVFFFALSLQSAVPWNEIAATVGNKEIQVQDVEGNSHRGVIREVRDDEIVLIRENGEPVTVARSQVKRVKVKSRAHGALMGLLYGGVPAGIVAGLGAAYINNDLGSDTAQSVAGVLVGLGVGAGVGIGAAVGAMQTVYKAPKTAVSAKSKAIRPSPVPYALPGEPIDLKMVSPSGETVRELPEYLAR